MKRSMYIASLLLCAMLKMAKAHVPPVSPCPDIYHYETDGLEWSGIVEAPNPLPYGSEMVLQVKMSVKAIIKTEYLGRIELGEERNVVLQRINQRWPIKYRVYFPIEDPLPSIVKIFFCGRLICSGPSVSGRIVTAIDLEHTLHSGKSALKNSPKSKLVFSEPIITFPTDDQITFDWAAPSDELMIDNRNSYAPTEPIDFNPKPPVPFSTLDTQSNRAICGTTITVNPLIISGETVSKGDWPWLVAMFQKKSRGLDFICAGSLISDKMVITAAHCVKKSSDKPTTKPQDIILKLGVHNLQDWTESSAVTMDISIIMVHEDYNEGLILNADIAVLVLKTAIAFTDYIRPVCLWSGETSLSKVIDELGMVVGWGKDEKGAVTTPEPKLAAVPIVSTSTCQASRSEFFHMTSDRTLCAGGRDGVGPCNGDSGGGLYLKQGSRWTLRGIVSSSLKDPETNSCDLKEFVVYTDAAKYLTWIKDL